VAALIVRPSRTFLERLFNECAGCTARCLQQLGATPRSHQHTQVQPQGLFRLIEPLMAIGIRRLLASDPVRLKSLLDAAR
jgi:hypothetical protein